MKSLQVLNPNEILFFDIETTYPAKSPNFLDKRTDEFIGYNSQRRRKSKKIIFENTPLQYGIGKIVCICGVLDEDWVYSSEDDERKQIETFMNAVSNVNHICGHNVKRFDIPYIIGRCLKLDISIEPIVSSEIIDTSDLLGDKYVSLEHLSYLCNLESSKSGIQGKDVPSAYYNGRFIEIMEYCMNDVQNTYLIFKKVCSLIKKT